MATQTAVPVLTRSDLREDRQDALFNDALLFCTAFTAGALVYVLWHWVAGATGDYWAAALSDHLLLSGLVAGEAFMLWNNGYRQGVRGMSIGKHRLGLRVVLRDTGGVPGAGRGLVRGAVMVLVLDLAVAAVPVHLPTLLRTFTPDSWHVGAFAYLALVVLVLPLALPTHRGLADVVAGTEVVPADGVDAVTAPRRRTILLLLDVVGVVGVMAVAANYVAYVWPILTVTSLW